MVTPFCRHLDLYELVQKNQHSLSVYQMGKMMNQMVEAVKVLHQIGLCHRDIQPRSLFVRDDLDVVLGSFGLASPAQEVMGWNEKCGASMFHSPEMVLQLPCGPAADIYALGLTLYYFLFGMLPWSSSRVRVARCLTKTTPFPFPYGNYPHFWLDIISKMLLFNPVDRLRLSSNIRFI
jgi:serine/threonine protein kinase